MFTSQPEPVDMYICFLPASESLKNTHVLNRLAAYMTPGKTNDRPMIHTELLFAEQTTSNEIIGKSCSIHYNGTVFFSNKRFSRSEWHFRLCNKNWDIQKAELFCEQHVGDKFNHIGYYTQPLCNTRISTNRWFCSEIVAGALRAAGADVEECLHPNALFESLKNCTVPSCPKNPGLNFL